LDFEGAEYEIIRTTPREVFDRIDHIAMEYHGDADEIEQTLRRYGFDITKKKPSILYADR